METFYKVVSFILLSAYTVKAAILTPSLNESLIIVGLFGLFAFMSKLAESSYLAKLREDNEKFKKDIDSLNTKLSSLALRNIANGKSLSGRNQ